MALCAATLRRSSCICGDGLLAHVADHERGGELHVVVDDALLPSASFIGNIERHTALARCGASLGSLPARKQLETIPVEVSFLDADSRSSEPTRLVWKLKDTSSSAHPPVPEQPPALLPELGLGDRVGLLKGVLLAREEVGQVDGALSLAALGGRRTLQRGSRWCPCRRGSFRTASWGSRVERSC